MRYPGCKPFASTCNPYRYAAAPDAIYAFAPEGGGDSGDYGGFDVDIKLCSRGYSQTLTVYEDGVAVRTAAALPAAGKTSTAILPG
jgi:hypothetical protein